ncbi:MAG: pyridoxine 5'-phosphate synthase [Xanthomonadales bacterium]|jgi:pyridoxine 5-phosphate synthase|nr:pyridoxine 5'-phosphate synthase [Xanthomonadales bacterium]
MTRLSVNLNKIAVLRNSRGGGVPDVMEAARVAVAAGADGVTVHPRPDLRHIRPGDVAALASMLEVEFNIEGNPFAGPNELGYPGFLELVERARPTQVTLVPDGDTQLTSDHGFDVARDADRLRPVVARLRAIGARVSLFVDAGSCWGAQIAALGAQRVEIYTGPYAQTRSLDSLANCVRTATDARAAGLSVNAGHDLDLLNLDPLLRTAAPIAEVSIGHALINDALYAGLANTVQRYLSICRAHQ